MTEARVPGDADPDQAWFWTRQWQAGERQADADIAAGRTTFHPSADDLLAALDHVDAQTPITDNR